MKTSGPKMQAKPMLAKNKPRVKAESPKECISGSSEKLTLSTSSAPQMMAPLALSKHRPTTSLHPKPHLADGAFLYLNVFSCKVKT